MRRGRLSILIACAAVTAAMVAPIAPAGAAPPPTTAWRHGALQTDPRGVVSRSDLVLQSPPWQNHQSMPLGNGRLGAAVWSEDGLTAQLNRSDTLPDLKSAGQLVVPGLFPLMSAADYRGRLGLYDADLEQRGGGMTASARVRAGADQFVLDVTGADPNRTQTADLKLWQGRSPVTYASGGVAALAETFHDDPSGTTSGAITAVTADGRQVHASVTGDLTVHLTFKPRQDGRFRIVVGVPAYKGGDVASAARAAVRGGFDAGADASHLRWWHRFWNDAAPMEISSPDGTGEYLENLRATQLYMSAASMRSSVPSSHGGVTSLFSPWRDDIHWSAANWWHFNLRQPVYTNLGAGTAALNTPYFRLYLDRLAKMQKWTAEHWPGAEGVCVPEFLRFDGTAGSCDSGMAPDWVNRILSTGPEVVANLWSQYRYTGDRALLDAGYPLMSGVARFYLSVLRPGDDGYLHLQHVNALEVQWDTTDPTPDLAAMRTIFPIVAGLADQHGDHDLAERLRQAVAKLPPFRTTTRGGQPVLAWSGTDEAAHNTQDPDLEALWPWGRYGADSSLMQSTFTNRVYVQTREWASDSVWAARLGRASDMKNLLVQGTSDFQIFPNGFAAHSRNSDPVRGGGYYDGWGAVVASALQESLVQSYEGTVRVAPAWPADWNATGAVQIPGGHRVSVETRGGTPSLVGVQAGSTDTLKIQNPWPGQRIQVVDGDCACGRPVVAATTAAQITLPVKRGASYLLERTAQPYSSFTFGELGGQPADKVKTLGQRTLGVAHSIPQINSDLVTVEQPDKLHALVRAAVGAPVYVDRGYTVTDLPGALDGATMIRGANDDSKLTEPADYLTFDLTRPATVYVAFDTRGEGSWWPGWPADQGFTRTDMTVQTSDRPLAVFKKTVPAGQVRLGPNSGVSGQGGSSYVTFVTG
ncbi:glycosyl hydrolase family 95 catalytic domain-containing protein [Actinoallomurus iriomotensis]|uniref:Glycosyl hydrolase family 95 catalytic domain-containing protein n=1 Tax=Actinoallomurus iriomotensis TaxID=478107 RepID=A0A9W6W4T4_9ACTN|nr:hypothetical protein [Actinoallomurus iriomotensis]GLY90292.1 hypothetical protein Airi02_082210 [Actinoallomurus iriomotensis]